MPLDLAGIFLKNIYFRPLMYLLLLPRGGIPMMSLVSILDFCVSQRRGQRMTASCLRPMSVALLSSTADRVNL